MLNETHPTSKPDAPQGRAGTAGSKVQSYADYMAARVWIVKDDVMMWVSPGFALDRALADGWTIDDPQPVGREPRDVGQ